MTQKLVLFGMLPLATQAFSILGPFNSPAHSFFMGLLVAPLLFAATQTDSTPAKSRPLVWLPLLALYATLVWSFLVCTRNLHIRVETIFAISAPWLFMTLAPLYHFFFSGSPFSNQRVVAASLWLGKMSYAIYIIHFPLLLLIGAVKMNPLLLIGLDVFLVISLAWFLTFHVEPALVAGFDRIWPRARKPVANLDTRRPLGAEK